jgi:hypothetical protein
VARFKDSKGRDWDIVLNVGLIGELKRDAAFDLGKAAEAGERFGDFLFADPSTLANVLWVLVRRQATSQGVTEEQFPYVLDGDAIDRAGDALMEAVIDFFHRRRAGAMKARLPKLLAKMDAEIQAAMSQAADSILSGSAGSSPESPA